jgi:hypothetical protein
MNFLLHGESFVSAYRSIRRKPEVTVAIERFVESESPVAAISPEGCDSVCNLSFGK